MARKPIREEDDGYRFHGLFLMIPSALPLASAQMFLVELSEA